MAGYICPDIHMGDKLKENLVALLWFGSIWVTYEKSSLTFDVTFLS